MEKIKDVLENAPLGATMFDEHNDEVRLWTLSHPFKDGRKLRALKKFFPYLDVRGRIIKLGGYNTLVDGMHDLAMAKVYSCSNSVQTLYKFDTPESLASIKHM